MRASDPGFASLAIWQDANADGLADPGEVQSLAALGMTGLQTVAEGDDRHQAGNWIGLRASFERSDGSRGELVDVWLQSSPVDEQVQALAAAVLAYGETQPVTHTASPAPGETLAASNEVGALSVHAQHTALTQAIQLASQINAYLGDPSVGYPVAGDQAAGAQAGLGQWAVGREQEQNIAKARLTAPGSAAALAIGPANPLSAPTSG